MKKRRVFIEGVTACKVKPSRDLEHMAFPHLPDQHRFNYEVNISRARDAVSLRHGTDVWPILDVKNDVVLHRVSNDGLQVINRWFRIEPDNTPPGCSEVWYLDSNLLGDGVAHRVWAGSARKVSRSLVNVFIRCDLKEINHLPIEFVQLTSMNIRPIEKIRFDLHNYFIPERNFCYIGFPYR